MKTGKAKAKPSQQRSRQRFLPLLVQ